jgi:hypothetical protein
MRPPAFWLSVFLRINAATLLPALLAVVMPVEWMQVVHSAIGLGDWPLGRLAVYLARSASLLYGALGALALYISFDVKRYLPLLGFSGWLSALLGGVLLALDLLLDMPLLWTLVEGPFVLVLGLILVVLVRRTAQPKENA